MRISAIVRSPALWAALTLTSLTLIWLAIGAPVSLITQIAIYTLYGAGVNLLVGYTGLVPFVTRLIVWKLRAPNQAMTIPPPSHRPKRRQRIRR